MPRHRRSRWVRALLAVGVVPAGLAVMPSTNASAAPTPLAIQNADAAFGNHVVGSTGSEITHVLINNGGLSDIGPLHFFAGTMPAPFSVLSETCSTQILQPNETCTVTTTFEPTAPGQYNDVGTFLVGPTANIADAEEFTVALSGVAGEPLQADPVAHNFGDLLIGQPSGILTTTFTNPFAQEYGPLTVTSDVGAPFEIVDENCDGNTVNQLGGACEVSFRYTPTQAGPSTQSVVVNIRHQNATSPGQDFTITLQGNAVDPNPPTTTTTTTTTLAPSAPGDTSAPTSSPTAPASTSPTTIAPAPTLPLVIFTGRLPATR